MVSSKRPGARLDSCFYQPRFPQVIFTAVNAFLGLAHEVTAVDMSANKSEKLVLHKIPKLTIRMVLRVARKLAKLVFRMIPSDEQKLCNLYKAAKVYSSIVSKRTPRFKYDTIKYREREEVEFDFKFFPERVDWLVRNGKNFAIDDCVDVWQWLKSSTLIQISIRFNKNSIFKINITIQKLYLYFCVTNACI